MEQGRFEQIRHLKEKGWQQFNVSYDKEVCGGPTYMLNPEDKRIYNVSCGKETPTTETLLHTDGKYQEYADGYAVKLTVRLATKQMFQRYFYILQDYFNEKYPNFPDECSVDNLLWMCKTAIQNIDTYPIDKLSRWLGFVQGVCVMHGFIKVKTERDFSRPLFHEAYTNEQIKIPPTLKNN